jgi:CRISPR-associated protein Cas1
MAYRNIVIENAAMLKCKNEQLLICIDDVVHSVPIEDISAIMLENKQSLITVAALTKLAQHGTTIYFCDDKHLPCAVLHPFIQHSRQTAVFNLQESLSLPTKKRLWQQIVQAKITNQARCLKLCGIGDDIYNNLINMVQNVDGGDSMNVEATAANYYFKHLFDNSFVRDDEFDGRNSALNYGYAIMRGHLARLLVVYGFLPIKGIHHHNDQNSFNLADDFMEPFRPVVDLFVMQNIKPEELLVPEIKRQLFNLLNVDMESGKQIHSVAYAAERLVQSFVRCCQDYKDNKLLLPNLVKLRQHTYE